MSDLKHRLVTRADLDGVACGVILRELNLVDEILFTHPADVIDGLVTIDERDILANMPYVAQAHRVFDHHDGSAVRNTARLRNHVIDASSASAARVLWNHYGGAPALSGVNAALIQAADQASQGRFTVEDVLHPTGWTLLNFISDARTGLGRFRNFTISNLQLMHALVEHCRILGIDGLLALPDLYERVELYKTHEGLAVDQVLETATQQGNALVMDLRSQQTVWAANRFLPYALFPQCNVVIRRMWGRDRRNTVFAIGRSIFERTCATDIGALCERFGGSGHDDAGSCQVEHPMAELALQDILGEIHRDEAQRIAALKGPSANS
jgi:nanoRNase/pAp phosphatase (c-di-AMP/oligoRNAs hydrolase)